LLDFTLIEPDHSFAVDNRHRRALKSHIQQLFQSRTVGTHVLVNKFDSLLRKKLFLLVAGASPGLTIDDHYFRHSTLYLRVRISPNINMSRCNSELFPAHADLWVANGYLDRRPKPVLSTGIGFCLGQLPRAPILPISRFVC
jgi:hypothetical protein